MSDKPFKTIEELVQIMGARGITVDERTPFSLKREGYYAIVNGYKDLFIDDKALKTQTSDDRFIKGTTFNELYSLFLFDRDLRLILFKYLTIAEATFKSTVVYQFSKYHKEKTEPYLDATIYRQERNYERNINRLIHKFNKLIGNLPNDQPTFSRPYIEHYLLIHKEVPIWVLANYLSFGDIFKFYDFQKESMRNLIAKSFSDMYRETHPGEKRIYAERLRIAFDHMKDFRNICAHDERLYCARVSPAKDITFAHVLTDLELVLTREEYRELQKQVTEKLIEVSNTIESVSHKALLDKMGIKSLDDLFAV